MRKSIRNSVAIEQLKNFFESVIQNEPVPNYLMLPVTFHRRLQFQSWRVMGVHIYPPPLAQSLWALQINYQTD